MTRDADIELRLEGLRLALQAAAVCLWTASPGQKAHPVGMAPAAAVAMSFWAPSSPGGALYIDAPKALSRVLPLAFRAPAFQPPHVALLQVALPAANDELLGLSAEAQMHRTDGHPDVVVATAAAAAAAAGSP